MNVFQQAINDIFKDVNFLEKCMINGAYYDCICTSVEDAVVYSDAGLVSDENFKLDIKLPISRMPKIGDKVKFRDTFYKISSTEVDSANASVALYLQSLSKRRIE